MMGTNGSVLTRIQHLSRHGAAGPSAAVDAHVQDEFQSSRVLLCAAFACQLACADGGPVEQCPGKMPQRALGSGRILAFQRLDIASERRLRKVKGLRRPNVAASPDECHKQLLQIVHAGGYGIDAPAVSR